MKKVISLVLIAIFSVVTFCISDSVVEAKTRRSTHVKSHFRKGKIIKSHRRHTPTHYKKRKR